MQLKKLCHVFSLYIIKRTSLYYLHGKQLQIHTDILAVTKILNEVELCPVQRCRSTKEHQKVTD